MLYLVQEKHVLELKGVVRKREQDEKLRMLVARLQWTVNSKGVEVLLAEEKRALVEMTQNPIQHQTWEPPRGLVQA